MSQRYRGFHHGSLFQLTPGEYHAVSELEPGLVPLISCGEENDGLIGYYDISTEHTHIRALTASFNGSPLTTNFHPYRFGAKDNVAILIPLSPMSEGALIYIAAPLNRMKWRYSYGRKCYREKLQNVSLQLPATDDGKLDSSFPDRLLQQAHISRRTMRPSCCSSASWPVVRSNCGRSTATGRSRPCCARGCGPQGDWIRGYRGYGSDGDRPS